MGLARKSTLWLGEPTPVGPGSLGCDRVVYNQGAINSAEAATRLLEELWEINRPYIRACV
jgi:hypothetical protein